MGRHTNCSDCRHGPERVYYVLGGWQYVTPGAWTLSALPELIDMDKTEILVPLQEEVVSAAQVSEGDDLLSQSTRFFKAVYRWNGRFMKARTPGEAPVRIYEFVGVRA